MIKDKKMSDDDIFEPETDLFHSDNVKLTSKKVDLKYKMKSSNELSDSDSEEESENEYDSEEELVKSGKCTLPINGDINSRRRKAYRAGIPHMSTHTPLGFRSDKKMAEFFLSTIDKSRGDVEWSNIIIGMSIKTIFGDEGFVHWCKFCPSNRDLIKTFRKFRNPARTIKSLAWFSRSDSPVKYHAWHSNWCAESMDQILSEDGNLLSLGILLARFTWLDYKSVESSKRKIGYYYARHGWNRENSPNFLNHILITKIKRYLAQRADLLFDKRKTGDTASKSDTQKGEVIESIIKKRLGDMHQRVTSEALDLLYDDKFMHYKSENLTMVRMNNLVVETTHNGIFARAGTPEDNLTLCTHIDYPLQMTMDSPEIIERERWCFETFGSDSLSEAMQTDMASYVRGGNEDKLLRAWVGGGNNSKSMHVECLSIALGDYVKTLPVSALSGKAAGQGAANAEIARTEGAFLVIAKEPEANEYIHGGRAKGFTGGIDHIYVRGLYEDGRDIIISWKLLVMSNHDLPIGQGGKALDNRMMVSPYGTTYTDDAPDKPEDQIRTRRFKLNKHFGDRLHDMAQAFWYLTVNRYFPIYIEKSRRGIVGTRLHPQILKRTTTYNRTNNLVLFFWDEVIGEHNNNGEYDRAYSMSTLDAFAKFQEFCTLKNIKANQMIGMDLFANDLYSESLKKQVPASDDENFAKKRYFGISLKQGDSFG